MELKDLLAKAKAMNKKNLDTDDTLQKATAVSSGPTKLDTTKLVRKNIVDSKGRRTTKWIRFLPRESSGLIWDIIASFFGGRKAKNVANEEYSAHNVKETLGVDSRTWGEHFLEYFRNKVKWDSFFSRERVASSPHTAPLKNQSITKDTRIC
jgi:hypothetical protein